MTGNNYPYIIVGGGLAAASAVEGIRELDRAGSIALIAGERHLPYDRPPLSKKLWFGAKQVADIFLHDRQFYQDNGVTVRLGVPAAAIDPVRKTVTDAAGAQYHYGALLLATGGTPRRLSVSGADLPGICYYRTLDDYSRIREAAIEGRRALVVGGGFIGSEMAAALSISKLPVTLLFPDAGICARVFPEALSRALTEYYRGKGIRIVSGDRPVSFARRGGIFLTRTERDQEIESDLVIVGVGINPGVELAAEANLEVDNGIVVNEYLQTSAPHVYAAGDNARFPCLALNQIIRTEHWDNARAQGKQAGRNMAGAEQPYEELTYFFSDLFEFGYEAVGEVDARLPVFADWREENRTGVIYYLRDRRVRGVMLCNTWEKLDAARAAISAGREMTDAMLRGLIR